MVLTAEVSEIRITAAGEGCADPDESLANPSSCSITPASVSTYDDSRYVLLAKNI